jgi:hypothetical protein
VDRPGQVPPPPGEDQPGEVPQLRAARLAAGGPVDQRLEVPAQVRPAELPSWGPGRRREAVAEEDRPARLADQRVPGVASRRRRASGRCDRRSPRRCPPATARPAAGALASRSRPPRRPPPRGQASRWSRDSTTSGWAAGRSATWWRSGSGSASRRRWPRRRPACDGPRQPLGPDQDAGLSRVAPLTATLLPGRRPVRAAFEVEQGAGGGLRGVGRVLTQPRLQGSEPPLEARHPRPDRRPHRGRRLGPQLLGDRRRDAQATAITARTAPAQGLLP